MNRIQRVGTVNLSALWTAVLALWITGCGVEVGNPSEPTPGSTKQEPNVNNTTVPGLPNIEVDSVDPVEPSEPVKIDVRYLVENQYDEAITAALDFAFDNTSVALALVTGVDSRTCGTQADGSLVLNHQETNSETRSSGAAADATLVTESFSRVFASRMLSTGKTLACNTSLTKPKLDWTNLSTVNIDGTLERTNSRSIVTDPAQVFVRESSVKSTGSHASAVKKEKYDAQAGTLQLTRQLQFGTDMEITNKTMIADPYTLKTRIETGGDAPLKISESYGTSGLKSLKISSGTITSKKQDDGLVVVMHYDDVVLDATGTCKPTSGTILGEIFLPSDPTTVYEKFSIAFTAKDNLIVYADGTGSKLEFEPCRIEIDQQDPSRNGGSNGGPRGGR